MKRALQMTIQLELNFFPSYACDAVDSLYVFSLACSVVPHNSRYINRYKALQRQAIDLKNYAFLHGYIDSDTYAYLANSIHESADLFWS
ncbi:MAG: putative membrane protein [Inoviridae sp.]|nr:MAG: putative membrane protein [Inoviridae sp.]